METKKILSLVALALSMVCFIGYIVTYRESQHEDHPSYKSAIFMTCSVILLIVGTGLAASYKSGDSKLEKQDYLNIVIVLLAIILIALAYYKKWGVFAVLIGNLIAILSATTMIILE